jgi:thiamine-phosphate pyrophosphorylase
MEDTARFALDDATLSAELKQLRHDLRSSLNALPEGWLEANRNTPDDVGTEISTASEMTRDSFADVVIAAGKRLGESLRVIEEMSKTIDAGLARDIKQLRYRAYDIEQRLMLRLGSGRAKQWRLCLILTTTLCRRPWREVLGAAIEAGADCVQVREKEIDGGRLVQHVRDVIDIARQRGVSVIVNDRVDVALAAGADGVHVGQTDLSVHDVRRIAGRSLIVGVSTHDLNEARRAVEDGADYCGVGAMFQTSTKQRQPSGIAYLRGFIDRYPSTPHLAIGGIDSANIAQLVDAGARGVAVSSGICRADDPGAVTDAIAGAFDAAIVASSGKAGG